MPIIFFQTLVLYRGISGPDYRRSEFRTLPFLEIEWDEDIIRICDLCALDLAKRRSRAELAMILSENVLGSLLSEMKAGKITDYQF